MSLETRKREKLLGMIKRKGDDTVIMLHVYVRAFGSDSGM